MLIVFPASQVSQAFTIFILPAEKIKENELYKLIIACFLLFVVTVFFNNEF